MRIPAALCTALTAIGVSTFALSAAAQDHEHPMTGSAAIQGDSRILVKFPEPMRLHTIISMRDHLLALQEIAVALSKNAFDKAASRSKHSYSDGLGVVSGLKGANLGRPYIVSIRHRGHQVLHEGRSRARHQGGVAVPAPNYGA